MNKPRRLAFVNSHPIQYFAPLYAYLNRDPTLDVTALYCSDFSLRGGIDPGFKQTVTWDVDLLSGYRAKFLGSRAKTRNPGGFWSLVCPEVWAEIRSGKYDAVMLHGYGYAAYVLSFLAAKSCGLPVFMRSETHLGLKRTAFRRWVRDTVLSFAYTFIDGFMSIGSANRDYYRALGVPEKKIFDVPYAVDNERFIAAAQISEDERSNLRKRFGVSPLQPLVLYASKLMPRKHPDDLVRAMNILRGRGVRASLLFVGTGEMEAKLRELVSNAGIEDVVFGGFINQAELPSVYAAADVFVLPSENEPWGLIINEVMCAGLPVVVSSEVGCVQDLVKSGENGMLFLAGDIDSLATALQQVLVDATLRRTMGRKSLEVIRGWSYERCLAGVRSALAVVKVTA